MANAWKKMGSLRGPAGAGADVATSKKAGVVKPSGDFDITADGTLSLYTPMSVMSFTGGSDHEIGETVDTVNLAWKLNKTPATLTLDGQEIVKGEDGQFPTSQPLTKTGTQGQQDLHARRHRRARLQGIENHQRPLPLQALLGCGRKPGRWRRQHVPARIGRLGAG